MLLSPMPGGQPFGLGPCLGPLVWLQLVARLGQNGFRGTHSCLEVGAGCQLDLVSSICRGARPSQAQGNKTVRMEAQGP